MKKLCAILLALVLLLGLAAAHAEGEDPTSMPSMSRPW